MNIYGKITLLALGVAVFSSAVTVASMRAMDSQNKTINTADTRYETNDADGFLSAVAHRPPVNTDFTRAAESTVGGVVSVKSYVTPRGYRGNGSMPQGFDPFDFFFGIPSQPRQQQQPQQQEQPKQQQSGLGSGVIISSDGYIVTNNHVVDGAERLEITLYDNRNFDATVIGTDPNTDLALIKIEATDLPVIPMGDSDALKVGEWVLAVGNPFGFTSTVTTGIVSAKARSIAGASHGRQMGIESYIQTDAAVNPGNSGGALVNIDGELIGINTAIYSQTGNYAGYSFAIPVSIVRKVVTDLKQYGTVQRAVLGIAFRELDPELAKEHNVTATNDGVMVMEVTDGSSAIEAGLKPYDVIVEIDTVAIHSGAQLMEHLARKRPGEKASIGFIRDNKRHNATVTLLNSQGSTKITKADTSASLGCSFKKADQETCRRLRIQSGLQVSDLKDGLFKNAGIKEGFIILDINNSRVSSSDEVEKLYQAIMKSEGYDKVMFISGVYPTGQRKYYAVPLTD